MLVVTHRGPHIHHLHTQIHRPPQVHTPCRRATLTLAVIRREQPLIQRLHTRVLHIPPTQAPHTLPHILDILIQVIHTLVLLILVQVTLNILLQITNILILHIPLQEFVKAPLHIPVRHTLIQVVNTLLIRTQLLHTPIQLIHMPMLATPVLVIPVLHMVVVQVFHIQGIPPQQELIRLNSILLQPDTQHSHHLARILQATNQGVTLQPHPLIKATEAIHQLEAPMEPTNLITRPQHNITVVTLGLVFNCHVQ